MTGTILIVDGSKQERDALTGILKTEYTILEADSAKGALSLLRREFRSVSAIVTDIVLPDMDGFALLKQIRSDGDWMQIPIIVTTELADDSTWEKAVLYGADNYVTKPYNRTLLLHVVQNAVRLREMATLSEQIKAEKRQRELNFELTTLLYTIPSGVLKYAADGSGQIAYINRNFVENLGYTEATFREKFHNSFHEMVYSKDRSRAEAEILRQEVDGKIGRFDYRVETADGQLRWIHDEGVRVTDQNGKSWYYVSLFDITDQREAEEQLRVSEEMNRLAMEHSGKIVTQFNVRKRTLTLPESLTPIFEVPHILCNMPEEQIALGRVSPETAASYRKLFMDILHGSASGTATYQQRSTKGWRWLTAQYTTVFSDTGAPMSAVITFTDVTEQLEKELVYSKWQQSLTDRPTHSYTLFRCNLSKKNAAFDSREGTLLALDAADMRPGLSSLSTGRAMAHVYPEDRERYLAFLNADTMLSSYYRGRRSDAIEFRALGRGDDVRWLRLSAELVEYPNSNDVEAYLMFEDIHESKQAELQTKALAETDPLTGSLNRAAFTARMADVLAASGPEETHALLMMDIDDFKRINDTYGHDAGDRALCELTQKVRAILRRDDLFGRLGGDEFLVLLRNVPGAKAAGAKARQICGLHAAGKQGKAPVTVSIGIAMIPQDGATFDALYKRADDALYRQKKNGKNRFAFASA